MVSVVLAERDVLFLHVPKTAGASISRALQREPDAISYSVSGMAHVEPCAKQLARQLPKLIDQYRTVTVVRNPWDWMVSAYLHVTANAPAFVDPPSFKDFLLGGWERANLIQYPQKFSNPVAYVAYHSQVTQEEHLSIDGAPLRIDEMCRFERLKDDLQIAFGKSLDLPHVNRSDRLHYSRYYDDETKRLIAERNAALIEACGYQFAEE